MVTAGLVEGVAGGVGRGGIDVEDGGIVTAATADHVGGGDVGGEVDVLAFHWFESFLEDDLGDLGWGAVVEGGRWGGGLVFNFDVKGVAIAGTEAAIGELESFFVGVFHHIEDVG